MNKIVKITLVGDIFPSNTAYTKRFGNGSIFLKDSGKTWVNRYKEYFNGSDITFGNLEVPLIKDNNAVNDSCFAGSQDFASTLNSLGFDVVSIANNHILEQGDFNFRNTQEVLSKSNVGYIGVFNSGKSNIVVLERGGSKFGFAAFNGIKDLPNPNLHADLTLENIKKTLDEMSILKVDYKLLSFHWGNEYIHIPSYEQIKLAHSVIEYGANVIIGHHPHVIQPVERYNDGIIIYSLGNFIFDFLYSKDFKSGMLVDLYFKVDGLIDYKVSEVQLDKKQINSNNQSSSFIRRLNQYETKMYSLIGRSKDDYTRYYNKKLKVNSLYQRLLMKIKVIELLIFSNNRKQLLKNISERLSEVI